MVPQRNCQVAAVSLVVDADWAWVWAKIARLVSAVLVHTEFVVSIGRVQSFKNTLGSLSCLRRISIGSCESRLYRVVARGELETVKRGCAASCLPLKL